MEAERAKIAKRLDVTKEPVLEEVAAMAFYDAGNLALPHPDVPGEVVDIKSPKDIRKLPERVRKCIVDWSFDRAGRFVLKLANKQGSLELLSRHLAMWVDKKELRIGDLATATDAELDAAIQGAARQIADAEGVPVETVLAQIRQANAATNAGAGRGSVH